jgi:DNA-binding response OmpR family regulator
MRVLIAEDDPISRRLLEATLERWGYEVLVTADGAEAWQALQRPYAPPLAILDWMMPGLDGVEVCRKVRAGGSPTPPYLILLTAKGRREDAVAGLEAGADDYVTKPFDRKELRARVRVGARLIEPSRAWPMAAP